MDQWETLLDGLPSIEEEKLPKYYRKIVGTARNLLEDDLATFEADWIVQTLLYKPLNFIQIIETNNNNNAWSSVLKEFFKLIETYVQRWKDVFDSCLEDIVNVCLLSHDTTVRSSALQCLTKVARISNIACKNISQLIDNLENSNTAVAELAELVVELSALQCLTKVAHISNTACKNISQLIANLENSNTAVAELAELVGTICECYPEAVSGEFEKIWRIYLIKLDSNKNTDRVNAAILQGIACVFTHFGNELPTAEISEFYTKLVSFIDVKKCENAYLKIFINHPNLFVERLTRDVHLRMSLWEKNHFEAVKSCYEAIIRGKNRGVLQNLSTELLTYTNSNHSQTKYTALRILRQVQTALGTPCITENFIDIYNLEFLLRSGAVDYETSVAISYCIDSKLPNSDKLLQSAILFFENLPSNTRKNTVVHGILNATPEVRNGAVTFLTMKSIETEQSVATYLPLWADLFDIKDPIVSEKGRYVFEDFMKYTMFVLRFVVEENEKPPEKLNHLHTLTSQILTMQNQESYTSELIEIYMPLLIECMKLYGITSYAVAAGRAACLHLDEDSCIKEFYKLLSIESCENEALLCETCLALIQAPLSIVNTEDVLHALKITFSRNDLEPTTISKALQNFNSIITSMGTHNDKVAETIACVDKLTRRLDFSGKDGRVAERDLILFLGKHGSYSDLNNNATSVDNILISKLKDSLSLNIQNPIDGNTYKLNLQRIVRMAIIHEDPEMLHTLLTIVCANLSTRKDSPLQCLLTRIVYALSVAHARGLNVDTNTLQQAVLMCDDVSCVQQFVEYISEENSPGVRAMLSDALEALLTRDAVSDKTELLVNYVADVCFVMLESPRSRTKTAGLNIMNILLEAFKNNNSLTKKLLPKGIMLITKTLKVNSVTTFENASKLFIDKIELFDEEIKDLTKKILVFFVQNGGSNMADFQLSIYKKLLNVNLQFLKNINKDNTDILKSILDILESDTIDFEKYIYVLAVMKNVFEFDAEACNKVVSYKNCMVANRLFCMEVKGYFSMEACLLFMECYREALLEIECEKTIKFLSNMLKEVSPDAVLHLRRQIKSCLSAYIKNNIPSRLLSSFDSYCQKLPLKNITVSLDKDLFTTEHATVVSSLKILLDIFNLTDLSILTSVTENVKSWPKIILHLFTTGYINNYKSKIDYLTDVLTVSVKFLTREDIKQLILGDIHIGGQMVKNAGIKFCQYFIDVFFEYLVDKPYVLLDGDMQECCILLDDIVKCCLKRKMTEKILGNVLDLVDQLWPVYQSKTSFESQYSLLVNMTNLPVKLTAASRPMRWADDVIGAQATSVEDRARLIGVLAGGDEFLQTYRTFASTLPVRLYELTPEQSVSFRALLDALAATRNLSLFHIIVTLSSGNGTAGWWDEAIGDCMVTVAAEGSDMFLEQCSWKDMSLTACRRILVLDETNDMNDMLEMIQNRNENRN